MANPHYVTETIAQYRATMANPNISDEEKQRYAADFLAMSPDLPEPRWAPNEGPQALAYISEADELFYGGSAGGGKAEALDSKVLTPFGWTEMGSLKVGSKVCASDGTITSVIAVHPQGVKDLYRVTMRDGGSMECCLDHLWLAWKTHSSRKIKNQRKAGVAGARKYTTSQIRDEIGKGFRADGRKVSFAIPVASPVCFNVHGSCVGRGNFVGRELDPYTLGLLIGDGNYTGTSGVSMSSADQEIIDHLLRLFDGDVRVGNTDSKAKSISFRGKSLVKIVADLKSLGSYGQYSSTKRIPRIYLLAPTEDRWALLQGLMDTDGWVEPKRSAYYTTISKGLAEDVVFLARSLGAVTSVAEKEPIYTHNEEKKRGQRAYCVRIKLQNPTQAFRLTRKRDVAAGIEHQSVGRFIESIEFSRRTEAQCITVAHPNSLYITDDFIVTHNSSFMLGLALTAHTRSLILRLEGTNLSELKLQLNDMTLPNERGLKNIGNGGEFRTYDGRILELLGCDDDKRARTLMGRPHDLKGWDEVCQFPESVFRFVNGWLRTTLPDQRKRVVCAGNPPMKAEEEWVLRYWGPWLDDRNVHYPTNPGKLRWFTTIGGKDEEVESGERVKITYQGTSYWIKPMSRTFIPASLKDNPDLLATDYASRLAAQPEPYRTQLLFGDMQIGRLDDVHQLIPSEWVRRSMRRDWTPDGGKGKRMDAAGIDCAMGGPDRIALAKKYGIWFQPLKFWPGKNVQTGEQVLELILPHLENLKMPIGIDVLATAGGSTVTAFQLKLPSVSCLPINFAEKSNFVAASGRLGMANQRSEGYWRIREALDPSLGPPETRLQLPDDPDLATELCAARWSVSGGRVQIEKKEDIQDRIGRSPDLADAVALAMMAESWTGGWLTPYSDEENAWRSQDKTVHHPGDNIPRREQPRGLEIGGEWVEGGGGGDGMGGFMGMGR